MSEHQLNTFGNRDKYLTLNFDLSITVHSFHKGWPTSDSMTCRKRKRKPANNLPLLEIYLAPNLAAHGAPPPNPRERDG